MNRILRITAASVFTVLSIGAVSQTQTTQDNADLLRTRETVWRAWFADDINTLRDLVPAETIVMSSDEAKWKNQADVFREADEFHAAGGRLIRLEFPRTEVQRFGDVAIVWSVYVLETETNGKRHQSSGRADEVFVLRQGRWTNPGWHTDNVK